MNLFGENDEVIRTLGFYQPWGSLMLHGKIETRKVIEGRKPPFLFGKYLFYITKKQITDDELYGWCGEDIVWKIMQTLKPPEPTMNLEKGKSWAIAIADFKKAPWIMRDKDEEKCFVANTQWREKTTWCLQFENVQRIVPFEFKFGKQGVGKLPPSEREKIFLAV